MILTKHKHEDVPFGHQAFDVLKLFLTDVLLMKCIYNMSVFENSKVLDEINALPQKSTQITIIYIIRTFNNFDDLSSLLDGSFVT